MTGKRQVALSLVDVGSSAERLNKMTMADDRNKLVSSDLVHACTSAIDTVDATPEAKHVTSVRRAYITIGHKALIIAPAFSFLLFFAFFPAS